MAWLADMPIQSFVTVEALQTAVESEPDSPRNAWPPTRDCTSKGITLDPKETQ